MWQEVPLPRFQKLTDGAACGVPGFSGSSLVRTAALRAGCGSDYPQGFIPALPILEPFALSTPQGPLTAESCDSMRCTRAPIGGFNGWLQFSTALFSDRIGEAANCEAGCLQR